MIWQTNFAREIVIVVENDERATKQMKRSQLLSECLAKEFLASVENVGCEKKSEMSISIPYLACYLSNHFC